jgi:hypothetical protein
LPFTLVALMVETAEAAGVGARGIYTQVVFFLFIFSVLSTLSGQGILLIIAMAK